MLFISGCVVYQWDPTTHSIVNKLDCSKLVPCSESLKSISIEEHLSPGKCQVCVCMCMCVCIHICIYESVHMCAYICIKLVNLIC